MGDHLIDLQRLTIHCHFIFGQDAGVAGDLLLYQLDDLALVGLH